jgi:hypothetical protein
MRIEFVLNKIIFKELKLLIFNLINHDKKLITLLITYLFYYIKIIL